MCLYLSLLVLAQTPAEEVGCSSLFSKGDIYNDFKTSLHTLKIMYIHKAGISLVYQPFSPSLECQKGGIFSTNVIIHHQFSYLQSVCTIMPSLYKYTKLCVLELDTYN